MTKVLASVSEISRVGGWALRGLGYPFGTAERGVRLLAWAEAVGCQAIASLRHGEAAIEASLTAGSLSYHRDQSRLWRVSAEGRHLLEVGGALVDLASGDARNLGKGQVVADGVFGFALLPALANLMAHRKLPGVIVYAAAQDDHLSGELARTGWLCVSPGSATEFIQGSIQAENDLEPQLEAISGWSGSSGDGLRSFVGEILSGRGGQTGGLAIVTATGALTNARISQGADIDYRARFADALENGVPIEAADLDYLYTLEMRTWAPTSERSRGQAGYGLY